MQIQVHAYILVAVMFNSKRIERGNVHYLKFFKPEIKFKHASYMSGIKYNCILQLYFYFLKYSIRILIISFSSYRDWKYNDLIKFLLRPSQFKVLLCTPFLCLSSNNSNNMKDDVPLLNNKLERTIYSLLKTHFNHASCTYLKGRILIYKSHFISSLNYYSTLSWNK